MKTLQIAGVRLEGLCASLPAHAVPNDEKAARATGVRERRLAAPGTTVVDLCASAARRVLADIGASADDVGAVVFVTFTQHDRMPASAVQIQARLGLPTDVVAFDVSLACSGWGYGLYLAALLARETGRRTLLLDGDVQSAFLAAGDASTSPLLADGGTAALIAPDASAAPWTFAFAADGAKGAALRLSRGGTIEMDGFAVFRFVATDVVRYANDFLSARPPSSFDWFVPHQPNAYMVRQLAKGIGFDAGRTAISCDSLGNLSSASVPATIAWRDVRGHVFFAAFGGGLSVSLGAIDVPDDCALSTVEW